MGKLETGMMNLRIFVLIIQMLSVSELIQAQNQPMMFGDTTRLGRPFAKDPHVISFEGQYLMYYSVPGYAFTYRSFAHCCIFNDCTL